MFGLKLYLNNSTVEAVSTINSVILKHELCVYYLQKIVLLSRYHKKITMMTKSYFWSFR